MKSLKIITLQLAALLCVGCMLTSCLDDDDDNNNGFKYLTKTEQQQAFNQIAGYHKGYICWGTSPSNAKLDSAEVTLNAASDSTIYIYNFPTKPLAAYMMEGQQELKDSLEKQKDVTLTLYTRYYHLSPVYFQADPYNLSYNVTFGGKSHKVEVAFYSGMPNYLYGVYNSSATNKLQILLCEAAIWVDRDLSNANPTNYLSSTHNFYFLSK